MNKLEDIRNEEAFDEAKIDISAEACCACSKDHFSLEESEEIGLKYAGKGTVFCGKDYREDSLASFEGKE